MIVAFVIGLTHKISSMIKDYKNAAVIAAENKDIIEDQKTQLALQTKIISKQSTATKATSAVLKSDSDLNADVYKYSTFQERKDLLSKIISDINCNVDNFESDRVC